MSFALRYALHLGYAPPAFRPQFLATVGTRQPGAHIEFAAENGFAGIFDPWAMGRPEAELRGIRSALTEQGLSSSSIVCVPSSELTAPWWADSTLSGRRRIEEYVRRACTVAVSLGSSLLAALVVGDGTESDTERQLDNAAANLNAAGAIAGDHGLRLGIEPMTVLPHMLVQSAAEAVGLVARTGQPAVGILFDTAHVATSDGDLVRAYQAARGHVVSIQVVDLPGRVEPGAGKLELIDVVAEAIRTGYDGLIDLEHQWANLTREGERTGLQRIRAFDEQVTRALRVDAASGERHGAAS